MADIEAPGQEAYRHVPIDIDVEQALLGAIFKDNRAMERAAALIKPETFYDPLHGRIFATMSQMIEAGGVVVTPLTLHAIMKADPGVIETGGLEYFEVLRGATPAIPDVKNYADILSDLATRRHLIRTGEDIVNTAYNPPNEKTAQQQIEQARNAIEEVSRFHRSVSGPAITATPFIWMAPEDIPPRKFLFASRHAIAGNASCTGAIGGTGKSGLIATEALAHATGRNLLNDKPLCRGKAWILGLEDDAVEHRRRITAATLLHKISPSEFEGQLFLDDAAQGFVVAGQERNGVTVAEPLIVAIIERIRTLGIILLYVDPFVACHRVSENDNGAIDAVARIWVRIANETGCAVDLVHHLRKGGGNNEPTVDDFRGGSSLTSAVRSARLLVTMDKDDATKLDVTERYRYFKIIDAKKNMSARDSETPWRQIIPIDLRNGPAGASDHVAAVTHWQPESPATTASIADMEAIRAKLADGKGRENVQAKLWVGNAVAEVLGLDLADPGARATVQRAIKQWVDDGVLKVVEGQDERRKVCKFVVPA